MSAVNNCVKCKSNNLKEIINLGEQSMTGVFPRKTTDIVPKGILDLIMCLDCSLVQIGHEYPMEDMYGENYGYRSGLNNSMVHHLRKKNNNLINRYFNSQTPKHVLDIGSNDGTFLGFYNDASVRVGIDPSATKFKKYYDQNINLIVDFFSKATLIKHNISNKFDIITSISMFYDLPDPNSFVKDIKDALSENGVWHFEQSYLPFMLETNSFDTICHEHIEYYSLRVIDDLLIENGLKIIDIELNKINGGSIAITACHVDAYNNELCELYDYLIGYEKIINLDKVEIFNKFFGKTKELKESLNLLIDTLVNQGKIVCGYGASTKGNVLLQYYGLDSNKIKCIFEVNEEKFGCFTPGTNIPIISEDEISNYTPDYLLVLPWHFKDFILEKNKSLLASGVKFIFSIANH